MPAQERSSSTRRFQFLGSQEAQDAPGHAQARGGGANSAAPTLDWAQLLEAMQLTEDQKQVCPQARPSLRVHTHSLSLDSTANPAMYLGE